MKLKNQFGLCLLLLLSAPCLGQEANPDNHPSCPTQAPDLALPPQPCEDTGVFIPDCEYDPLRCTGYDTVIFYIQMCSCFSGQFACAIASSSCPPPPPAPSCPRNKPEDGRMCEFNGSCRYNARACTDETDPSDIQFDVCECSDGMFTCTSDPLRCDVSPGDSICPSQAPTGSCVAEDKDITCKYGPDGCINTNDLAIFTKECICQGEQWMCASALLECPEISEPPLDLTLCYPGDALVQVQHKTNLVPMKQLEIGEMVLVADGRYEPIYSFGHKDPYNIAEFVELKTSQTSLHLSAQHMVWEASYGGFVPASSIKQDDVLLNDDNQKLSVTSVRRIQKKGMYAPFTPSGTLVVDHIVSSSYVAIPNLAPLVDNFKLSYQWMAHTGEFPHRFACHYMGLCRNESYDNKGINQVWCTLPLQVLKWVSSYQFLSYPFLAVSLAALFTFWIIEQALLYPLVSFVGIVAFLLATTTSRAACFAVKIKKV